MTHFTAQKRQNKFSKENRLVKGIENVLDFKIENNNPYKGNVKFETRYGFRFLSSEVHLNFFCLTNVPQNVSVFPYGSSSCLHKPKSVILQ